MTELAQKLEAFLFTSGDPVSYDELADVLACPADHLEALVNEVVQHTKASGLAIVVTPQSVQLVTNPAVSSWLGAIWPAAATELTPAAAETLALIAYRGPITRADIDVIRGVDSRRMVRQLAQRELIRPQDQSAVVPVYAVTELFLQLAGVARVQDLPNYAVLSSEEKISALLAKES